MFILSRESRWLDGRAMVLLCLASAFSTFSWAAEITGVELNLGTDSNPANAEFNRDVERTFTSSVGASANIFNFDHIDNESLSSNIALDASADFGFNTEPEGLSQSVYNVNLGWAIEQRQVIFAPLYAVDLSASYLDSETNIRDGTILAAKLSVNLEPFSFFNATFAVEQELREADTEVFDTTKTVFSFAANITPFPRFLLQTGVRFISGDEVSSASPTFNIVNNANAVELDDAFTDSNTSRLAYLVDADTLIYDFGAGYQLSAAMSLGVSFSFIQSEAEASINYERNTASLTFNYDL